MGKKTALLLTAVLFITIFAGCSGQGASPAAGADAGSSAAELQSPAKKDQYVIGFSQSGAETEFVTAMSKDMQESYAASDKFELIFSDGQGKQENQIKAVRSFIQQGVDAIVLRPVVTTGWDAVLQEAKDAGIPLITVNRSVDLAIGDVYDYVLSFVGPDNVYAGALAAQIMVDLFEDTQGPVNVAILEGTVGSASAIERTKGIDQVLGAQDKLVVKYKQTADYNRTKGKEVFESFLKSAQAEGIKIDALIAQCDDMAIGAIQAIEEAGLKPGEDIRIVGIDGVRGAFEAMVEGKYDATIENPQGYGAATIELWTDYFEKGIMPESWIKLENIAYPRDVAAKELPNRTW